MVTVTTSANRAQSGALRAFGIDALSRCPTAGKGACTVVIRPSVPTTPPFPSRPNTHKADAGAGARLASCPIVNPNFRHLGRHSQETDVLSPCWLSVYLLNRDPLRPGHVSRPGGTQVI